MTRKSCIYINMFMMFDINFQDLSAILNPIRETLDFFLLLFVPFNNILLPIVAVTAPGTTCAAHLPAAGLTV